MMRQNNLDQRILSSEKFRLEKRNEELSALTHIVSSCGRSSSEELIMPLGCDMWAVMKPCDATNFLERQFKINNRSLKKLDTLLPQQTSLDPSMKISSSGAFTYSSPSLPTVEIQELLDEDGSVISATLNKEPFAQMPVNSMCKVSAKSRVSSREASGANFEAAAASHASDKDLDTTPANPANPAHDVQIAELLEDMGLFSEEGNSRLEDKLGPIDDCKKTLDPQSSESDLSSKNFFELELIAESIQSEENDLASGSEFDYDFETSDDDVHENEDTSDFTSIMDTTMVPELSGAGKRLEKEIIALRQQRRGPDSHLSHHHRRVHFDDSLQIKQIENISEDLLNIQHKSQKLSKFKEAKLMQGSFSESKRAKERNLDYSDMQNDVDSSLSEVVFDISEGLAYVPADRTIPITEEMSDLEKPRGKKDTSIDEVNEFSSQVKQERVSSDGISARSSTKCFLASPRSCTRENHITTKSPCSDDGHFKFAILEDDTHIDELARAYIKGDYDEDIRVTGPIVSRLDDFDLLSKVIQSTGSKNESVFDHEHMKVHEKNEEAYDLENNLPSSSDDEYILDRVIERENADFMALDEEHNDLLSDQVQRDVTEKEISESYYRLKEKLTARSDIDPHELEFNDVRSKSKFKMRHHR